MSIIPLPGPLRGRSVKRRLPWPTGDRCARGLPLLALLLLGGCGGAEDVARRALCERVLAVIEPEATPVPKAEAASDDAVQLGYLLAGRAELLTCRFAPAEDGFPQLAAVATTREGELAPSVLFFLKTYALARGGPVEGRLNALAYLAQQLINALAPASIYGLLALGYSLIYGLIGRVNLAFGEFCAMGTLAALAGAVLMGGGIWQEAGAALLAVVPVGVALGAATHAVILRPLARRTTLAFLIASLGLSIGMSEAMRLAQGSRTQWFPPGLAQPLALWRSGEAVVTVSTAQLLVGAVMLAAFTVVMRLMRRTPFGRAWRACADDAGAAALVGVDIDRTLRRSAMLAAVCATLAGGVVALQYGIVGFDAGLLLGFKALTAAIVGGIGSPAGAALGGALIGLTETLWAAYLPGQWRDLVIFGVLAFMLVLRPYGLLGQPFARDNPMLWRGRDQP